MFRSTMIVCLVWAVSGTPMKHPNMNKARGALRIVGGRNASIATFPYQLSLNIEGMGVICGAAMISPSWALTTASCASVTDNDYMYTYFDEGLPYILSNSSFADQGERTGVDTIIAHPEYNSTTGVNNLALLELAAPLSCVYCTPINISRTSPNPGDVVTFTGWGETSNPEWGEQVFPEVLQSLEIPVINGSECEKVYPQFSESNMFCGREPLDINDTKPCAVDQGGPAIMDEKLAGIFSYNGDCFGYHYPAIFIDVSKYVEWIDKTTTSSAQVLRCSFLLLIAGGVHYLMVM